VTPRKYNTKFLALRLKQELENLMKRADLQWEWKEVIRGLDGLQQVEADFSTFKFKSRHFLFRSQFCHRPNQNQPVKVEIKPASFAFDSRARFRAKGNQRQNAVMQLPSVREA
jgi:hypothetical protein